MASGKLVSVAIVAVIAGFIAGYGATAQQMVIIQNMLMTSQTQISDLGIQMSGLKNDVADLQLRLQTSNFTYQPVDQTPTGLSTPALTYQRVKDSVVLVEVTTSTESALGSGFIYDFGGHVVTNQHVVDGATGIRVTFLDGSSYQAVLVGEDRYSDIAVVAVKAPAALLRPLVLGNSSALEVGTPIMAIGNPFGLSGSLTAGIVSQVGRTLPAVGGFSIPNVIQLDAAVNPGNSGGPLLNYLGEVVGVTTAIQTETGSFSGIGYAIPSNALIREVPVLIEKGRYDHPWLGVQGVNLMTEISNAMKLNTTKGWLIVDVTSNGPADKAGLKGGTTQLRIGDSNVRIGGDVIVRMDGTSVRNGDDVSNFLEEKTKPGQAVSVTIIRSGVQMTRSVTLGTRPPPTSG